MLTRAINTSLKTGGNQRWGENQSLEDLQTKGQDWGRTYWLFIRTEIKKETNQSKCRKTNLQTFVGSFPYQILVVAGPEVWDKAVLSQSSLIDQLNPSWVTCFHFKINVSLVFCQLWGFSTQLENNQGDTTSNSSTKQDSNSSAVPQSSSCTRFHKIILSLYQQLLIFIHLWMALKPARSMVYSP